MRKKMRAYAVRGSVLMKNKLLVSMLLSALMVVVGCQIDSVRMNENRDDCRVLDAVYYGDVEALVHELNRGCDPQGESDHVNEPIYTAIVSGRVDIVELLLGAGVDPGFDWGEQGGSLLTNAVQFGHLDIVELLVSSGAGVNREVGHSALYRSIVQGKDEIKEYLESQGAALNDNDKEALKRLSIPF